MNYKAQIIFGPTASGKSALALALAQKRTGVIINADAMQLYRELRVVTARPTEAEEAQVPHVLYGVLPAAEAASAGWWVRQASAEIRKAWRAGRLPIIVGGTGMYIKCLMEGIAEIPEISQEVKERVRALQDSSLRGAEGDAAIQSGSLRFARNDDLYKRLQSHDLEMAARLKPGDTQRIMRALEVLEETGKSLLWWQAQGRNPPLPEAQFDVIKTEVPRAELYARCDARFLKMLEQGAEEEVKKLMEKGLPAFLPAMRALGVPEIMAYLEGEIPRETMIKKAQQSTRNYAKRQITWMRNQLLE